jgi:cytochrome c peroxidase
MYRSVEATYSRKALMCSAVLLVVSSAAPAAAQGVTLMAELGGEIFFDQELSINRNQSCAACHEFESGWTGPDPVINAHGAVYEGSIPILFGNRKPPSSAYATQSPVLHIVMEGSESVFTGGNFWDGSATGEKLGNPAADQAQGPFLNPVEQALPDSACVVYRVCNPAVPGDYPVTFEDVWGMGSCDIAWPGDIDMVCAEPGGMVALSPGDRETSDIAFDSIALSIAAFEASPAVNAFSSKYDAYLAGQVKLTNKEKRGLALFRGKARCDNCHILDEGPNGEPPLFTDFTYDNIGVPRNPENPWYTMPASFNPWGFLFIDFGLGGFLQTQPEYQSLAFKNAGKQKVPTLRNVDKRPYPGFVKAYGHNGYFKSLEQVVHFYNTRDTKPPCADPLTLVEDALEQDCWPIPEVPFNVNTDELGDLNLSRKQERDLVAFLKTLSDGYICPP